MGELIDKAEAKLNKLEQEIHDLNRKQKSRAKPKSDDNQATNQQNIPLAL